MQFDTAKFERCRALGAQRLEKIDEPREQRIEPAELIGIRQDERDRLYEEAKKAVQSRDEVLAAVSHDLKNPLTAMPHRASRIVAASPLIVAKDAEVIDSSHLTIDGVVGEIIGRLKMKGLPVAG